MRFNGRVVVCGRIAFAIFVAVGIHPAVTNAAVRVLALTGQAAPGTNAVFSGPPGVSLNDHGGVAIFNFLHDGITLDVDNLGFWSDVDGSGLQLIAHVGDQVPGKPAGVLFDSICCGGQINEAGQVAFQASMTRGVGGITAANSRALWVGTPNNIRLVAQGNDVAVGVGVPRVFLSFSTPSLNSSGQLAWYSQLDPGVNLGIWSEGHGTVHALASDIHSPPFVPGAMPFGVSDHVSLNDAGDSLFYVVYKVNPGSLNEEFSDALWLDRAAGFQLVAARGDAAPGLPSGAVFSSLSANSDLNNAGQAAFMGQMLVGAGGVTANSDQGIWAGPVGGLKLIARTGDVAPGAPANSVFWALNGDPIINHSGQVVFGAQTTILPSAPGSANPFGIWKYTGAALQLVAQEGEQAAGAAEGTVFKQFDLMSMNAAGQAMFRGFVGPSDASAPQDSWLGLWAQDVSGALHLIARNGGEIDVDNGPGIDLRTVSSFSFYGGSGGEDGGARAFNALGQIAFSAIFTDNTAAAVIADVVAVPEPGTIFLTASAVLSVGARRRRKVAN